MINCIKKPRAVCFLFALIFTVIVFTASSPAAQAEEVKYPYEIYDEQNNTNTAELFVLVCCMKEDPNDTVLWEGIDRHFNMDEVVAVWRQVSSDPSKYGGFYGFSANPSYKDEDWLVLVPPEYVKENHDYVPSDFSEELVGFVQYVGPCYRLEDYDVVKMYPAGIPTPSNTVRKDMTDMLIACPACFAFCVNSKAPASEPWITRGDVNGDGKITVVDARLVLRAAIHLERGVLQNCDVDYDGRITVFDARVVLRYAIKKVRYIL